MNKNYVLGLICTLSLVSPLSVIHAAGSPNVFLSEINWAGSEKSTADEWLTLRNIGGSAADISGWQLTGVGTSGSLLTIPVNTLLDADQNYLIANYTLDDPKIILTTKPNLVTTAVSIPNSTLKITVLDANGNIVDSLTDPGSPDFGSSTTFTPMLRDMSTMLWQNGTPTFSPPVESAETPPAVVEASAVISTTPVIEIPTIVTSSTNPTIETPDITQTPVVEEPIATQTPIIETATPTIESTTPVLEVPAVEEVTPAPIMTPLVESSIEAPASIVETPVIEEPQIISPIINTALIISALLPSPNTDEDEWVQLTNTSDAAILLDDFMFTDASGKVTKLIGTINAHETTTITNPLGNLNNDGDSITLATIDGVSIDAIVYGTDSIPAPKKNQTLALVDGSWIAQTVPVAEEASVPEASIVITDPVAITPVIEEPIITPVVEPVAASIATPEATPIIETTTPITTTITTPSSSTTPVPTGALIISELLPSPSTGVDEWVELANTTDAQLSLDGLSLIDASGKSTVLAGTIDAHDFTLIPNPSGNLNNDGDSMTFINTDGGILDAISYGTENIPAPKKDQSLALVDGSWVAGSSTPGAINTPTLTTESSSVTSETSILTPTISPILYANSNSDTNNLAIATTPDAANSNQTTSSTNSTSSGKSHVATGSKAITTVRATPTSSTSVTVKAASTATQTKTTTTKKSTTAKKATTSATRSITLDDVGTLGDETKATIEGIVVAEPGIVGKRSFFIDGLEIYQSTGTLANIHVGDDVKITGTLSVLSDHRRINISEGSVITVDHADTVVHDYVSTLPYGSLVRITGTVSARDGDAVLLKTETATIKIVSGNGVTVSWADLAGATVTATGILKHGSQDTLVLRSADDLVKVSTEASPISATTAGTISSSSGFSSFWLLGSLLSLASIGFGSWVWFTRPRATTSLLNLHPKTV